MSSDFQDARGIVFTGYLQKGYTINKASYANLVRLLQKAMKTKRLRRLVEEVLFHKDNISTRSSLVSRIAAHDCAF